MRVLYSNVKGILTEAHPEACMSMRVCLVEPTDHSSQTSVATVDGGSLAPPEKVPILMSCPGFRDLGWRKLQSKRTDTCTPRHTACVSVKAAASLRVLGTLIEPMQSRPVPVKTSMPRRRPWAFLYDERGPFRFSAITRGPSPQVMRF